MQTSLELENSPSPALHNLAADRAYQALTVAAMIVLLATLWAF